MDELIVFSIMDNKSFRDAVCNILDVNETEADAIVHNEDLLKKKVGMDDLKRVYLHCYHYTTTIDDNVYLKKNGPMSLYNLLKDEQSSIFRFLQSHDIEIDVDNELLRFKEETYNLNIEYEDFQNKNGIRSYVYNKLRAMIIHDKCQLEAFISINSKSKEYSCVESCPEAISKLDGFLDLNHTLINDWINKTDKKEYLVEFDVRYYDLYVCQNQTLEDKYNKL